jgi:colanic acid/amylovoran biosynthesis glycosyltransferase
MKNIHIITSNYPFSSGEFFLNDELEILKNQFDKIFISCIGLDDIENGHMVSDKYEARYNVLRKSLLSKFLLFRFLFSWIVIQDLIRISYSKRVNGNFLRQFYHIINYRLTAERISKLILKDQINFGYDEKNTILYSYWADERAIALAVLKNRKKRCKFIVRAHRVDLYEEFAPFYYLPFREFLLKNCEGFVCISEDGSKLMKQKYLNHKEKIFLFKLGKANSYNIDKIKKENSGFLICSCSVLKPVKQVDKIIDVLSKVDVPKLKWVHFGGGNEKENILKNSSKNLDKIEFEFKGNVSNKYIMNFYSSNFVDLFINLSLSEGIPVSIMEAQSFGIPVIATDVGGTKEIVNQQNGFLVETTDTSSSIAEIITNYLTINDLSKRTLSRKNWEESYNSNKNYMEFAKFLLSIV